MDDRQDEDAALFGARVGTTLREARLERELELKDIAADTRVPLRHLEAIENGAYDRLPAPTYSVGFVKSFAREVGLDPEAIARSFREEIRGQGPQAPERIPFVAADPARVPPRALAWTAALIAVAVLVGYGLWRNGTFGEDADDRARLAAGIDRPAAISPVDPPAPPPEPAPEAPPTGPVVLTANDVVWLRIYELDSDEVIHETEMQPGDRFEIPAEARNPAIRIGRAEAIDVTVGGRRVAALGPPATTLTDVSLRAADLVDPRAPADEPDDEPDAADPDGAAPPPAEQP